MSRVRGVAITRPREDALKQATLLESQGMRCFIVPMLEIEPLPEASIPLRAVLADEIQAICITRKHALPALATQAHIKHLPLFVVGKATSAAAADAGFKTIHTADGTAESLLAELQKCCTPEQGSILYARGEDITLDITSALRSNGYRAFEVITYKAHLVTTLPDGYIEALQRGEVDEIHFYSERSAVNYVCLIMQTHLLGAHHSAHCYCLSDKVATPLRAIPWCQISLFPVCE